MSDPVKYKWGHRDPGNATVNNGGGEFRSVKAVFNPSTNRLNFRVVLSGQQTDGFTLVLNSGEGRNVESGRTVALHMDKSQRGRVRVSAYAYNGKNRGSFRDGDMNQRGRQAPDMIHGYKDTDWIRRAWVRRVGKNDQKRVFRLTIDASTLMDHDPRYGDASDWIGTGFTEESMGMWIETYRGLHTNYLENGMLKHWRKNRKGMFETLVNGYYDDDNDHGLNMVPLPTSGLMGLAGLGGVAMHRRRRD